MRRQVKLLHRKVRKKYEEDCVERGTIVRKDDDLDNSLDEEAQFKACRTVTPLRLSQFQYIPPRLQRILSALRTGVWHPLGIAHEAPKTCKCGATLVRARGVAHMFVCPLTAEQRAMAVPPIESCEQLWSDKLIVLQSIARYALDFKAFLHDAPSSATGNPETSSLSRSLSPAEWSEATATLPNTHQT